MDKVSEPSVVETFIKDIAQAIHLQKMEDVDDIVSFIEKKYGIKEHLSAYNDFLFSIKGQSFKFNDNYGDEDDDALYKIVDEQFVPIALGISFEHGGDIYCVDYSLEETDDDFARFEAFKTSEPVGYHVGKRCFYHRREQGKPGSVSMKGYEKTGRKEKDSENWSSGPRTLYPLHRVSF